MRLCRYSSLVEHQLPKLRRRVRFPLSAVLEGPSKYKKSLQILGFLLFLDCTKKRYCALKSTYLHQSITRSPCFSRDCKLEMGFYHTARNDIIHLPKRRAKKPAFYIPLLNSNLTNLSSTVTSLNTDVINIKVFKG